MDESSAVQAPATRLRRRLSVEQSEDLNSPGPSTPSKKRGGRLAAKPKLELIDENVTPARRSTRIKSNTSIISETTQTVDSPRAKRAARRTSQISSDNESVVTPPVRTYGRRTRKDSASSVDKLDTDTTLAAKPTITVIIVEENEVDTQKSNNSPTKSENNPVRKSPRLQEKKKDNVRKSKDNALVETDSMNNDTINDLNIIKQDDIPASTEPKTVTTEVIVPAKSPDTFSDTSFGIIIDDIIKDLDKKPKSKPSLPNKSMSALENDNNFKSKRRTNSLNVIFQAQTNDSAFLSDDEKNKKRVKSNNISAVLKVKEHRFASGDSKLINTSLEKHDKDPISNRSETSNLSPETSNLSLKESQSDLLANTTGNKENISDKEQVDKDSVINFLKKPPSSILETTIVYDDSDTDMKIKDVKKNIDSEDQCVPVVETRGNCENSDAIGSPTLNKSNNKDENILNNPSVTHNSEIFTINVSCEPMDVDETIPNNTFISETSDINKTTERGDLKSLGEVNKCLNESSNKSKRKSSTSHSTSQDLGKSGTENKSTLILSQLKDVSSSENNLNKSHQEILSKSTTSDTKNKKKTDKKNLSLDYSTSTPVQQKHLNIIKKFGLQINTSAIETSITDKKESTDSPNTSKKKTSKSTDIATSSDEESGTDDESSKNLLDNEASVASDDYESGDSQDDEDKQYEKENEILEKGETLDSEEDITNDSDYEKDSFIVSSDDTDRDLLSGSGDDLSMTDNELTMSATSKKKYNERKLKEQKKASKEMFEARHNTQNATKANKKSRKLESSDDSEKSEDEIAHRKKNRQRLDSTHDDTDTSKVSEGSFNKNKKNKSKRLLSESDGNESVSKEPEITTVFNNSAIENDPLSTQVKQEPKTPLKDFNVSTVPINEAIEEVVVENNESFSKTNQTTDPLQATMMDDDESSLSENSEIMNNYDSILNQLNNSDAKSKNIKSHDTSLNPINKTKNTKIPIVEELNLTYSKKSKRNKKTDSVDVVDSPNVSKPTGAKVNKDILNKSDEDSSSDSIDLHLLFSEDSSNISINQKEKDDDFIPLKRTPAKTNILNQDEEQSTTDEIRFVIDTQSTRENTNNSINMSLNSSTKKKKKKNKSINISQPSVAYDTNSGNEDAPLEMPFNRCTPKEDPDEKSQSNDVPDISSAESAKKKHSIPQADQSDVPAELTIPAPDSAKKSKKKQVPESQEQEDTPAEPKIPAPDSVKKSKKKQVSESREQEDSPAEPTIPAPDSVKKSKKKRVSQSQEQDSPAEPTIPAPDSVKKSKKKRVSESQEQDTPAEPTIPAPDSLKKSKKKRVSESREQEDTPPAEPKVPAPDNAKKSKKKRELLVEDSKEADILLAISGSGKKKHLTETEFEESDLPIEVPSNSKKRKRKSSVNHSLRTEVEGDNDRDVAQTANISLSAGRQNKKRKISQNEIDETNKEETQKKEVKLKKRKRDEDDENNVSKKLKESSFDKVHVPRLPASILNQLEDKPKKEILDMKKLAVISTTPFVVEEAKRRKSKPSNYLEESVYLNDSQDIERKLEGHIKRPKVLPFVPTATTSGSGFTTTFKIKAIPQEVKFVAQTKNVTNFKTDYLYGNKIKRQGTYEMYKKHRTYKISKF